MFKKKKSRKRRNIRVSESNLESKEEEEDELSNLELIKKDQNARKNAFQSSQIEVNLLLYYIYILLLCY